MRLLRRSAAPEPRPVAPGFAEWLLSQFAGGAPLDSAPFAEVERICANAGSLLIGAASARPEAFPPSREPAAIVEAALIARRTADGFKAALADRQHTVIAWPWDHIATSAAWAATRSGDTSAAALGDALTAVSLAYATSHREQLSAVLSLWSQVAGNVHPGGPAPDLAAMGAEMHQAYRAIYAPAFSSPVG